MRGAIQYTLTDLGTLGGRDSGASGINNNGQVVGSADTSDYTTHAFLYSGGSMQDLGTLGGNNSEANGINNSGQVVGAASTSGDSGYDAFLYSGGSMQDLGTLGGTYSYAYGINNSGQVVGQSYVSGPATRAFLYSGGSMQDLGTLPAPFDYSISANAINNGGQVVGVASSGSVPVPSFTAAVPCKTSAHFPRRLTLPVAPRASTTTDKLWDGRPTMAPATS